MTRRGQLGLGLGFAFSLVLLGQTSIAQAQVDPAEETESLTTKPTETKTWWEEKFGGSTAEVAGNIGSGTFYISGYHNSLVSTSLQLRPRYNLGTKYKLSLNARLYLEEELTQPDNPTGRRLSWLDAWVWLAAKNLYTEPRTKIRIGGVLRGLLPISPESLYANTITVLTAGLSAARPFEFGRPDNEGKKWELVLSASTAFSKYLQTSIYRGTGPGDTTGCRASQALPTGVGGGVGDAPSGSESDRCGGPLNTNFSFTSTASAALSRGRYSLMASLSLINGFKYAVPQNDLFTDTNAVVRGRTDATWGVIAVGYNLTKHLEASAGLSSYQPALDPRYRYPRFPFFDFTGTNANNMTQVFVGLNGTL